MGGMNGHIFGITETVILYVLFTDDFSFGRVQTVCLELSILFHRPKSSILGEKKITRNQQCLGFIFKEEGLWAIRAEVLGCLNPRESYVHRIHDPK